MNNSDFQHDLIKFNNMYALPAGTRPSLDAVGDPAQRLANFKDILLDEIDEVNDIIQKINNGEASELDILTDIADWLGDVQVYCASEMTRFGISNDAVLKIIMQSNFSKLGPDGKPIHDARGKVLKGPNFYPPEGKLAEMLEAAQKA